MKFKKVTAYNSEGKKQDDAFFINPNEIVSIGGEKQIAGKLFCCLTLTHGAGCWIQMSAEEAVKYFKVG